MGLIYVFSNYVGGLIGYIEIEFILMNVFLSGVIYVFELSYVGGLFGYFKGILENVYVIILIIVNIYVVGIVVIYEGEMNEIFYSG